MYFKGIELPGFSCGALQQSKVIPICSISTGLPMDFLCSQLIPNRCRVGQLCLSRHQVAASSHVAKHREITGRKRTVGPAKINMRLWRLRLVETEMLNPTLAYCGSRQNNMRFRRL